MTQRERILAVYHGQRPDVVPFMLDLSHWFCHARRRPWDLSVSYPHPESELIQYHKSVGAGFYIPNLASILEVSYGPEVEARTQKTEQDGLTVIAWSLHTPQGRIWRQRTWSPQTYSWHVSRWGVQTPRDLEVLAGAMATITFRPAASRYQEWASEVGEIGVVYASARYSAMGHLLNNWMGVERTVYAAYDWSDRVESAVYSINGALLGGIDALCQLSAEVILLGDNFSSDLQPPSFFNRWSRPFYTEAIRRIHAAGKRAAVHVDGRMRGLLGLFAEMGMDCIDAATPAPMGDLSPRQCREEAGPDLVLSGGVSPSLWLPEVPAADFDRAVIDWLELRKSSPRLIAAAGDQVPPGAMEDRILRMRDLVEEHGRY